jgi:hypothetical protein
MTERVFNLLDLPLEEAEDAPPGHRFSGHSVTEELGATRTGLGIYSVEPGHATWPYHFELVEEEWLIVLEGELPSSVAEDGDGAVYPDSDTFVVRTAGFRHRGRLGEQVAYWEGES